jgi:hypothetical protein
MASRRPSQSEMRLVYPPSVEELAERLWDAEGVVRISVLEVLAATVAPEFREQMICDLHVMIVALAAKGFDHHQIAQRVVLEVQPDEGEPERLPWGQKGHAPLPRTAIELTATALASLFQKAYARAIALQRMDEEIGALLEQRQRLENEFREAQAEVNDACERMLKSASIAPAKILAQLAEGQGSTPAGDPRRVPKREKGRIKTAAVG